MVNSILHPPPPQIVEPVVQEAPTKGGSAGGKKGNSSKSNNVSSQTTSVPMMPLLPVDTPKSMDQDAFSVLDEADRKVDQVELLRDRKTLDHAIHLQKIREEKLAILTNRLINDKSLLDNLLFIHFFFSLE